MLKEKQNHESFNLTENIYPVSDFTNSLKNLIEEKFSFISIKGEISNLSQPTSGHIYFTLKDEKAEIKAVMFRGYKNNLKLKNVRYAKFLNINMIETFLNIYQINY